MPGMRHGRPLLLTLLISALAAPAAQAAPSDANRYSLAQGCFALTSGGSEVAGPFRMKPTALGRYLLYTKGEKYLGQSGGGVGELAEPGPDADWVVDGKTGFIVDTVEQMVDAVRRVGEIDRRDCREHVETNFSVQSMVDGYEKALSDLITNHPSLCLTPSASRCFTPS